jgi:hypothetical protein
MTIIDKENSTRISEEKKDDTVNHDDGFLSFLKFIQGKDVKDKNASEEGNKDQKNDVHSIDKNYQAFLSFLRTVTSPAILTSPHLEEKQSTFLTDRHQDDELYDANEPYYPASDSKLNSTANTKKRQKEEDKTRCTCCHPVPSPLLPPNTQ